MRRWLLPLVALAVFGCGAARATAPSDAVAWRGAAVSGARVADALPVLEAAWQQTPRDWEPRGWWIEMHDLPFDCPGWGLVRGCTDTRNGRRQIGLIHDQAVATYELCNARRWDQTRQLIDKGCAP